MSEAIDKGSHGAGKYSIKKLILRTAGNDGVDITNKFSKMKIYEDMYAPFITGSITLEDTTDMSVLFGTSGTDLIEISLLSDGLDDSKENSINGLFWIYKRGDRNQIADKNISIELFFASMEFMIDSHTVVPGYFEKMTGTEIILKVIKEYWHKEGVQMPEKEIIVNKDNRPSRQMTFVSNLWSPSKIINYCQSHCIDDDGDASYFFFENRHGFNFLNFKDIYSVYGDNGKTKFKILDSNFAGHTGESVGGGVQVQISPEEESHVIRGSRRIGQFDALKTYNSGGIKNNIIQIDLLKREFSVTPSKFSDNVAKTPVLNEAYTFNETFAENVSGKYTLVVDHYDLFSDAKDTVLNSSTAIPRAAALSNFSNNAIEIDLTGRTDLTVGMVADLDLTRKVRISAKADMSDYKDYKYSGDYIITAIAHTFEVDSHSMTLELSRDGILAKGLEKINYLVE